MKLLLPTLLIAGITGQAMGYSSGPLDGYAGNPPLMNNCTECHDSNPLNSGTASISVIGLPDFYYPGETYTVQMQLQQTGQSRWGFELTSLKETNYQQAGSLNVTAPVFTQLSVGVGNDPDYLKHTTTGTFQNSFNGPVYWNFSWTAPTAGSDTVGFYLAMNAANGDESNRNDYIYTRQYFIPEATTPTEVISLSLVPQNNIVQMSWNPSTGANLYFVKRYDNPYDAIPFITIPTLETSFTANVNFASEVSRYYRVSAVRGTKLSTRVQGIFTQNCVTCHMTGFPTGGMDLSEGNTFLNTVSVLTEGYQGSYRVVPFDTSSSVLWHKINNTGLYGDAMPLGAPMLSPIDRADIARWIAEGAVNY
ncbi:MAG: hypothetical protein OEM52_00195 [bacterium]|nr:hypothetical protein [bacterium]